MENSETFTYKRPLSAVAIAAKRHRRFVGGKWGKLGKAQLEFMQSQGLLPEHYLLDVGCGALRAGRRFIGYLEPAHYYGIDINKSLIEAGYKQELGPPLRKKTPRKNLRAVDRFQSDMFDVQFDYAIAQSVFTHVSLNHIRLCLHQVAKTMKPGGRFFATFFEAQPDVPLDAVLPSKRGLQQEANAYWYYADDLRWAATFGPWEFRYIGDWNHPRGQKMVEFTRTGD